jgi:hypothetical protein
VDVFTLLNRLRSGRPDDKDLESAILGWCVVVHHYTGIELGDLLLWTTPRRGVGYAKAAQEGTDKARQLRELERDDALSTALWDELCQRVPMPREAIRSRATSNSEAPTGTPTAAGGAAPRQEEPPADEEPGQWSEPAAPRRAKAEPGQPSQDRQNDIIAAIVAKGTPLTRPELVDAMRLTTEGKLGAHLAWMVRKNHLVNIPHRGYWPTDRPVPE